MTKLDLQKELLEKIKPGTKPSDLKKKRVKNIQPKIDDEGYSSEEEPKPTSLPSKEIKELKEQVSFWSQTANTHLKNLQLAQAKVSNSEESNLLLLRKVKELKKNNPKSESEQILEKNKQIEIIAKENEKNVEKVKELQTKIAEQDKTIQELKNQVNDKANVKQEDFNKKSPRSLENSVELFTCYHCHKSHELSLLVLELPEGKLCQPCWTVLRKKTKQKKTPQLFTCVVCEEEKQEIPNYKKVDISYKTNLIKGQEYPVCLSCSPQVKEYNEHEDQEFSPGED